VSVETGEKVSLALIVAVVETLAMVDVVMI
jgi:hypothetical protein